MHLMFPLEANTTQRTPSQEMLDSESHVLIQFQAREVPANKLSIHFTAPLMPENDPVLR